MKHCKWYGIIMGCLPSTNWIYTRNGTLAAIPMIFVSFCLGGIWRFGMVIYLENHLFAFAGIVDGKFVHMYFC